MEGRERKPRKALVALGLLLGAYTLLALVYLYPRDAIANIDFWYHISVGYRLAWGDPQSLVDGVYPLGYPLLLRVATQAGVDALRFGHLLSWAGGLLLLGATFSLTYQLTRRLAFAAAGALLLLFNVYFLTFATYEGNDMLAAGLQLAALATLWASTAPERPRLFSPPLLLLHGTLLGLAYLTRYTALILLPVSLLYLLVRYRPAPAGGPRSPRPLLRAGLLVFAPFMVVAGAQLVPAWQAYGNPFYNEQAKNVWFGIYGAGDWVNNWGKAPDDIRLAEVIAIDPERFFRHWWDELRRPFVSLRLWPLPLHVTWIIALPALALSRALLPSRRLLLLLSLLLPLAATALAWLAPRFLLVPLALAAVLTAWVAWRLHQSLPWNKRLSAALLAGLLILSAVALQGRSAYAWLSATPLTHPQEVNRLLRLAGMEEAAEVGTNDPYLHAADNVMRSRYQQTIYVDPAPESVEALLEHPAAAGWRYLVLDYHNGFGEYGHLREAFRQARSHLAPLSLSERRDIFCLRPCPGPAVAPLSLSFDNGMQLAGYRLAQTDEAGALYLYWQAEEQIERSYKVSVRVVDPAGHTVAQVDSIPQSWSLPTTAWPVATPILDFYYWELEQDCAACTVALLVYEELSQEPVLATAGAGNGDTEQRLGPVVELPSER